MQVVARVPDDDASPSDGGSLDTGSDRTATARRARGRRLAAVLGLLAAACAIAVPLLPVVQDTARIVWPNGSDTRPVNAPLVAYWAQDLQVELPCATIRSLDARTRDGASVLFATVPSERAGSGAGMQLEVERNQLTVVNRGQRLAQKPLPPGGCDVRVSSDVAHTTVTLEARRSSTSNSTCGRG